MASQPHPFLQPYADRNASSLLTATKEHVRMIMADADEVRNTDLSGQYGGIYVRSLSANFNIDTEDTQADDGLNVLHDDAGNHFLRASDTASPSLAEYGDSDIVGGSISVDNEADIVIVSITTNANLVIPAAASRTGRPLEIKKLGAGVLTPDLDGSETLDGLTPSGYAISVDGGYLKLAPRTGGYGVLSSQL